jgi:hypothetical protein
MTREERAMLIVFDEGRPKKKRVLPFPVYPPEVPDAPEALLAEDADPMARMRYVLGG